MNLCEPPWTGGEAVLYCQDEDLTSKQLYRDKVVM